MNSLCLTLPDGQSYHCSSSTKGIDVAQIIYPTCVKKAVAYSLDDKIFDLSSPIQKSGSFSLILREDEKALDIIRHSTAHVLAQAVQELWPDIRVAIGPVIKNGFYYDFDCDKPMTSYDLSLIEEKMRAIITKDCPLIAQVYERENIRKIFADKGEHWKVAIIDSIPETEELKVYSQGDWFDLCRGPHVVSTGQIGFSFKLMKVSGSYWRGDSNNKMLTRIYGTVWVNQTQLDEYLHILEESEKRDHRRLGKEMDLFHFKEESPGVVFWHPKGWTMFQNLVSYMRRRFEKDYQEVNSPEILDKGLWQTSGHWDLFRENMFQVSIADDTIDDSRSFMLKPMNCPGHIQIFKHSLKSYRDLPVRLAEFGKVHRYEPSGSLHGLMRVRGFTQDDAHIFCTEEQMADECLKINDLILSVYKDFGFEKIFVKLATRPEKRVGSDALWDRAETVMKDVLSIIQNNGHSFIKTQIMPGEGAFYGPKYEYTLEDSIGREWQCGTIQVDFNLPERFSTHYVNSHSEKTQPVMIHRAICGSMERFLGILIENYSGHFPLWFSPVQVVVATITQEAFAYAHSIVERLRSLGIRAILDDRNEKINYKIREHLSLKVPCMFICGKREMSEQKISLRRLGSQDQEVVDLEDAIHLIVAESTPPDIRRNVSCL